MNINMKYVSREHKIFNARVDFISVHCVNKFQAVYSNKGAVHLLNSMAIKFFY